MVCLEPVAVNEVNATSDVNHELMVVQKSGRITCLSADIQHSCWSTHLDIPLVQSAGQEDHRDRDIRAVFIGAATKYEKGLLKHHPEWLQQLGFTPGSATSRLNHILLLGMITTSRTASSQDEVSTEALQIFAIFPPTLTPDRRPKATALSPLLLPPGMTEETSQRAQYKFDLKRGLIVKILHHRVLVFDLFQSSPHVIFDHTTDTALVTDCVPINRSICFLTTSRQCSVMDMKYKSVQAQRLNPDDHPPESSRKRKRGAQSLATNPTSSVHFLEGISTVAGLDANRLIRCQVSFNRIPTSNKRRKQSRLADALGKGHSHSTGHPFTTQDKALSMLAESFEWVEPHSRKQKHSTPYLQVRNMRRADFSYMASRGYITPSWIQQALQSQREASCPSRLLTALDVVDALCSSDATLVRIAEVVLRSPTLGLPMLTSMLRQLLHSFEVSPKRGGSRLLKDVTDLTNGDLEHELQVEEDDAAREIDFATALLDDGLQIRTTALRACFEKLATCFHLGQVSRSLKSTLSPQEILLMIDVLRLETRRGGWISHTLDFASNATVGGGQSHAISAICCLLNCAVDALGTGPLLASDALPGMTGVASFVAALRNETSAILEGVQESTFFDGFLKDFLHYEQVLNDSVLSRFSDNRRLHEEISQQYLHGLVEPAALPISTKSIERISSARIDGGGEIKKRSARDIGQKISERIGPYSFESIRF